MITAQPGRDDGPPRVPQVPASRCRGYGGKGLRQGSARSLFIFLVDRPILRRLRRELGLHPPADPMLARPWHPHLQRRRFQLLNPLVLFCSAACKTGTASFTMRPHPDVGEGASPQLAWPLRAFFLGARKIHQEPLGKPGSTGLDPGSTAGEQARSWQAGWAGSTDLCFLSTGSPARCLCRCIGARIVP